MGYIIAFSIITNIIAGFIEANNKKKLRKIANDLSEKFDKEIKVL